MINESYKVFSAIFQSVFAKNGLNAYTDESYIKKFYDFTVFLLEMNGKTNLTAIEDTESVIIKHYADSLLAAFEFAQNCSVIDVGCGAGFPSIPLAIVRPDLKITALDSTGKKIDFVKSACKNIGIKNVDAVCDRAELFIKTSGKREFFDYATARAVSRLNVLTELMLPFIKTGGKLIAMKGKDGHNELDEARKGISILGGELEKISEILLYDTQEEVGKRTLITIKKISETPSKYPRAYAKIAKRPI